MKRPSTGNEAKHSGANSGLSSSQRLAAAGSQAIEAHTRVRWLADRLGEQLDAALSADIPHDIDPEDSMVMAVEKAASTLKAVTVSMAAVASPMTSSTVVSTKPGIAPPIQKPSVKTKLGVGTGSRSKTEPGEE